MKCSYKVEEGEGEIGGIRDKPNAEFFSETSSSIVFPSFLGLPLLL